MRRGDNQSLKLFQVYLEEDRPSILFLDREGASVLFWIENSFVTQMIEYWFHLMDYARVQLFHYQSKLFI